MKNIIVLIVILQNCLTAFSQNSQPSSKFKIGVEYSINFLKSKYVSSDYLYSVTNQSYYGLSCEFMFTKHFSIYLKPKFHYSNKKYPLIFQPIHNSPDYIKTTSIFLPIEIKYNLLIKSFVSPYIGGGINFITYKFNFADSLNNQIKPSVSYSHTRPILNIGIDIKIRERLYVDVSAHCFFINKNLFFPALFDPLIGSVGLKYRI